MILYFDCFSGASGDMIAGSLIDAGVDIRIIRQELAKLKIKGLSVTAKKVKRGSLVGTKFDVNFRGKDKPRSFQEILSLINRSKLQESVKRRTLEIFARLAKAESAVHKSTLDKVHFHEVGDVDSIVDVVAACVAIENLDVERIYTSHLPLGTGRTNSKDGTLPIPGPATLELVKGVPVDFSQTTPELLTPTGAAILTTLSETIGNGPPLMRPLRIGYGAGTRDLSDRPNLLRAIIGEAMPSYAKDEVVIVETNIDDMSPLSYEYILESLFEAGALDVYLVPVQMKKSRPGTLITISVGKENFSKVVSALFKETTTIGLRYYNANRLKLVRKTERVNTRYGRVNVKFVERSDGYTTAMPEYEDCRRLAKKEKRPFSVVYEEAKAAALKILTGQVPRK